MTRKSIYCAICVLVFVLVAFGEPGAWAQFARPTSYVANNSSASNFSPCGGMNIVNPETESFTDIYYLNGSSSTPKTGPGPIAWTPAPQWGWLEASGYFSGPGLGAQTAAYLNGFPAETIPSGITPMLYYSATLADGNCAYVMVTGSTTSGSWNSSTIAITSSNCYANSQSYAPTCFIELPSTIETSSLEVWFCVQATNSSEGPPGFLYIQDVWVAY
jgi:hypothetical protein